MLLFCILGIQKSIPSLNQFINKNNIPIKMARKCPKCGSEDVEFDFDKLLNCKKCSYSESEDEINIDERSTQSEKRAYTPYRTGGGQRTKK
jgi:ribosomal protein S27AE